jgi:hypothetical protein
MNSYYDIYLMSKMHYQEQLDAAALKWRFRNVGKNRNASASSLSERLGDWFISIGMKLKAQQGSPRMGTHLAHR